jgi:branched-chain amino acid transport system permease protein
MKTKLLSSLGVVGLVLATFLAVIIGGWSVLVLAVLAGALVGYGARDAQHSVGRAVVTGTIVGVVVAFGAWFHNTLIQQLPGQEEVPAEAKNIIVYLGTVVLAALVAGIVAFLNGHENDRVRRYGMLIFLLVCAVIFPFYEQGTKLLWASAVIVALFYILQALGLNIVAGYAGMLDLGYVAFFAIGGYTAALLMSPQLPQVFAMKWSFWIVIFIAAALAAIFGLILGAPVIPLRGDYLAIVTLGFGEIVPIVFKNLEAVRIYEPISEIVAALSGNPSGAICLVGCPTPLNLTNGTQGVNPISRPNLFGYTFETGVYIPWYFLILFIVVVSAFFIYRLRKSRIGRSWVGMRDNELAANAMGVPLVRTKLTAFMIGAMFSGFAGAFYASYVSFVSPEAFEFSISVIVLAMVILGGQASIPGVILGGLVIKMVDLLILDKLQLVIGGVLRATVLQSANEGIGLFLSSLFDVTQYKLLLFGLILVIMMMVRPQGLIPASVIKYQTKS